MTRRPAPRPASPTETNLHLRTANHLHAVLPGANPRCIVKPGPGRPGVWEPRHPWAFWWHTPNEGKRSLAAGGLAKGMGLRTGFADFGFGFRLPGLTRWVPAIGKGEGRGGRVELPVTQMAVIELKREGVKTSVLSPYQVQFRDDCQAVGIWWAECRTVREVDETIRGWLEPYDLAPKSVLPGVVW